MKAKNLNNDESIRFIIKKLTTNENESGDSESKELQSLNEIILRGIAKG